MFRIKICGVTRQQDAQAAVEAGADAIGLNFYKSSPRCVSDAVAAEIAASVRGRIKIVGVFVNHSAEQVRWIADSLQLDYVQLHGDEPLSTLQQLGGLQMIRAFRPQRGGLEAVVEFAKLARTQRIELSGVLIDAYQPGHYGGTGETTDWESVRTASGRIANIPLVLAGGLNPENVANAISAARPSAVDTASGVEVSPGMKSRERMSAFVSAAKAAFLKQVER